MVHAASTIPPARDRTCADARNVAEIAQKRLRECPYPVLRRVTCRCHAGVLVLTGDVPTFYMKQIALALIRSLDQVERIDNRLVVSS